MTADKSDLVNRSADKENILEQLRQERAAAEPILARWRKRFPSNAYAWPGSPEEFAVEALRAIREAN